MTGNEAAEQIISAFNKLDETERLIFMGGLRALSKDEISVGQFEERVQGLIDRHRCGEELRTSDLAFDA
ncbi:hypothetical protein KPG71_04645 [Roseovarius sp. PS-C2]|uniref:hypothetical protein n=1 Tax=Roseovarius sp. PS-C2 TaxID=2820814 RepID=UPI001C0CE8C0|nr:hypothetical protein [Roseovarius sp. PS-C2]MBU3259298.1 hypothetical protein [Roseovarius sp. PS-C2]